VLTGWNVEAVEIRNGAVRSITARHESGEVRRFEGEYFFSTMPVQELINSMNVPVPKEVKEVSDGLMYRDFITVGLLLHRLKASDTASGEAKPIKDNWIYIQEPDVLAGRLQIFNNWSPYMVGDPSKIWVGVEYFCYETDKLWKLPDQDMAALAAEELDKIGIIDKNDVVDSTVLRMPKTYPAYFGTYDRFDQVRDYLSGFSNLFLVGRNGMHKYNNQDHSMLTAMIAVDNILAGRTDKANLWEVNTEMEYHEEAQKEQAAKPQGAPVPQPVGSQSV
jgi:protoporphyrinogen oxidase